MVYIIKKDGTKEEFDASKIKRAVNKSAGRVMYRFTDDEINFICKYATDRAEAMSKERKGGILIQDMHNIVEGALEQVNPAVAGTYPCTYYVVDTAGNMSNSAELTVVVE